MAISGRRAATQPIAAMAATIAVGLFAVPARADTNVIATASAGVGVTDNVASGSTGTALARTGGLWLVNTSLEGNWTGQTQTHDLRYSFGLTRSFSRTGHDTQTHALTWSGTYTPSGKISFSGMTAASLTRLDAINIGTTVPTSVAPGAVNAAIPVDNQVATAIPSATSFFSGTAHLTASWRPSPLVAWTETTSPHVVIPVEGHLARTSYGVDQAIGHDRTFGLDTFISSAQLGYLVATELRDSLGNVIYPANQALHARALAGWHRDLTPFLNADVSVGGLGAMSLAGGPIVIGPSWRGSIMYVRDFGTISGDIDHLPVPSLYVGRLSVSDRLTLRLAFPIDRAGRFHAIASAAFNHARFMDNNNKLQPGSDSLNANAGVTFQPLLWPVMFALRYTRLQQVGHSIDGALALPDIERQVVMVTVTGTWSRYPAGGPDAGGDISLP